MGVSIAISALIKLVDNLVHANEKAIEKAEELRDKYNDFKETNASNVKTLNDLKDEFEELSDGVSQYGDNISLTTEQYARYQEIVQQIVGMSPSLAEGYDTENGYIADKNGLLERAIELQEIEYRNELRKITNLDNLKTSMSGYIAEYKEALNGGYVTSEGNIIGTTIDTDFKNSLWQVFNTNNRDNYDGQSMATEDLKVETNKIRELAEKGVDHVTTYFYQSDSATKLVGGEWTTNSVTWISGKYVWQKVITYYKDRTDNSQTAKAICISGANGQDGKPGENGVKGKGVKSITPQYAISDSNVLQPNEGWSDKEPEWSEGKYIWTRTLVIYDDNTQETTTPIVSNGLNSALSISTVARKQANTANTNASNALTTATSANTTAKEAETKAQQSLDQFLWLVKSGSSSTSLTLTDSAVAAITKQFIIKSPDGSATIIEGGKLKTDALKSNNYVAGNDGTYSSLGTFLDLSNGEIHTPGFYLDSVGNAFYQGTVNADAGYFGDANNNWYIGSAEFDNIRNKDDALVNGVEYSALISKGNAALTAGHWYLMSQDGSLGIQSGWTTINGGNYVFDKETQKYYDMANISDWETYVYSAQGTRTKNTVLAAPNGSDGKATFRTLVEADIPTLSKSKVGLSNVDNTADSTKNVLSASKLTTARNITIGLAKKSFDGALDISFSLSDIGASSSSHTHNYASKVILAGTDYSCVSNAITITKANLQTAIGSTGLGLMTEKERSKLDSIKVSSGGTIDFSGVTASGALAATIGDDKTVAITHNVSGVKAGTYKSVTVDTYGHVTAGTNPTTLSGYGITDALSSSTKYALSDSVGGNALKANLLANLYSNRPTNANIAITGSGGLATFKATKLMTTNKPKSDGHILHFYWDNTGGYDSQLAVTIGENPELQIRGQQASIWGEWQTVLSSNNYTDYTVKKDGTGASGTWGISITGNAATATKATSADSATKATQDGNGNVISSTYLPLTGGSMTGTIISSSAAQVLRWTSSATSVNSTGCSWYGLGTYRADDGYNWLNISNYWGINFTTTSSNRFTHNGNIIITSANIGSQSVASATKATQDGAGNVITSKYVTIDTTQTISGSKTFSKETTISSATASTNKTTGALKVKGGIASEGQISADKVMIGDAVTLEYNAELQCLNFVFA